MSVSLSPALSILTVKAGVDPTDSRDRRSSRDDELIKITLGVRALWLGQQHVHDVQSRQEDCLAQAEISRGNFVII